MSMKSSGNERRFLPVVRQCWKAAADHHSKSIEKREKLLLLCLGQIEEAFRHVLGLALVALDCALQRQRFEVMHEARPHTQAPKWRRAEFVRGILRPGLDDAVAGPDVVQQKI